MLELYQQVLVPFMSNDYYPLFGGTEVASGGLETNCDSECSPHKYIIDFASFLYICSIVLSRSFAASASDKSSAEGVMMLPLIDMCNGTCITGQENVELEVIDSVTEDAAGTQRSESAVESLGTYALRTTHHIAVGSELLLPYQSCTASNADYLLSYGYLPLFRTLSIAPASATSQTPEHIFDIARENAIKLTNEVIRNPRNDVDLSLHCFITKLLDIIHPPGHDDKLRADKWNHLLNVDSVPEVLRVSSDDLISSQPQILPIVSKICRLKCQ